MKLNIILPHNAPDKIRRFMTDKKDQEDNIDIVETTPGTDQIKKLIESSDYEYFLIFDPRFRNIHKGFIRQVKKSLVGGAVLTRSETISKGTFISFKKGKEKNVTINHDNLTDFIKEILDKEKNNIKYLGENQTSESQIKDENTTKKNVKRKAERRPGKKTSPKKVDYSQPKVKSTGSKPKVLFICDVKGWAWWIKSEYIKYYLEDEFQIDIIARLGEGKKSVDPDKYDLYFTYGYSFVDSVRRAPFNRRITGVTAHRPMGVLKSKMKQAFAVHANSVLLLNELKGIHNNCYYLPNGVDITKFHPKETGRNNIVFGHVGKLSPQKGQKAFIEPAVEKAGVEYFPHYNNYKSRVPHNQMVDVYKNFDVKLVASFEDGTPGPALEAAACGKPLISNKIGNMPEFIKHGWNGLLVNRDINSYAEAIKYFKDNPDEVIRMGRNARITAEKWDWSRAVDNYRYMFKDILQMS